MSKKVLRGESWDLSANEMSRKIVKTFFTIIMIITIIIPKTDFATENEIKKTEIVMAGDINGNNKIDNADLLAIMRHIYADTYKGEHDEWLLTGNKFIVGDVTQNGKIDASDRLILLRYLAAIRDNGIASKHPEWLELADKKIEIESITNNSDKSIDEDIETLNNEEEENKQENETEEENIQENETEEENKQENKQEEENQEEEERNEENAIENVVSDNKDETDVKDSVKVNKIKLDKTNTEIKVGETQWLIATIEPNNATQNNIIWKSSNDDIVTVAPSKGENSKSVTFHGYKPGKVTITATCDDKSAECIVTVKNVQNEQSNSEDNNTYVSIPEVQYKTHIQSYGWQEFVKNGATSGTTGKAKRVEAILINKINTNNSEMKGSIQYRTYVQGTGWTKWVKDGETSGTTGKAKRIETIQIKLTKDLEKNCDIYYRTHIQGYGWLGWTKNGESAGAAGIDYRIEAIQIKIVKKGKILNTSTPSLVTEPLTLTEAVVKEALGAVGVPYTWGGKDYKRGMDCSGLVTVCYKRALGVNIPHGTKYLINDKHFKTVDSVDKLSPGDIIVCRGTAGGHVGIWAGDNKVIHEYPHKGCKVVSLKTFLNSTGPSYGKYKYRHYIGN